MTLPKLIADGANVISGEHVDRVMIAAALTAEHAALIVRAVNTFDQAKAALKDACLTYAMYGDQPPQKWLDALAAMEAL